MNAATPHDYRPDIDGLRAIAVVSAAMFHAFPTALPGGFVGVDIFFVISGYLITGLLVDAIPRQSVARSIGDFYRRRVLRIFPSLITVMVAAYALGWFSLYPEEFKDLAVDLMGGATFTSNIVLFFQSGYFDSESARKPLLHLWSLGVEEQFYILWPLILIFCLRLKLNLRLFVALIIALSFAANVAFVADHPTATFYLPLARFWELAIGGLLSIVTRDGLTPSPRTAAGLSGLGLALCAVSIAAIDEHMTFPGWWVALPVLGATCVLAAGGNAPLSRVLLANPVMVWIGRISYPIYLWHWVLLAYATILTGTLGTPVATRIALLALTVLLSWLTYVLVEQPIRFGAKSPVKWAALCAGMVVIAVVSHNTWARGGYGFRRGADATADVATATLGAGLEWTTEDCLLPRADRTSDMFCRTDARGPARFAVWGDSKAEALYPGLVRNSTPDTRWQLVGRWGCPPVVGVELHGATLPRDNRQCDALDARIAADLAQSAQIDLVALVFLSNMAMDGIFSLPDGRASPDAFEIGLRTAIDRLRAGGKRIAIVIDNPNLPDPRGCMERTVLGWPVLRRFLGLSETYSASDHCALPLDRHLAATAKYREIIARVAATWPDIVVTDPTALYCDDTAKRCPISRNGKYLYSYGNHISDTANDGVARLLIDGVAGTRSLR